MLNVDRIYKLGNEFEINQISDNDFKVSVKVDDKLWYGGSFNGSAEYLKKIIYALSLDEDININIKKFMTEEQKFLHRIRAEKDFNINNITIDNEYVASMLIGKGYTLKDCGVINGEKIFIFQRTPELDKETDYINGIHKFINQLNELGLKDEIKNEIIYGELYNTKNNSRGMRYKGQPIV